MFLIGACFEGSGINASDTLNNPNFRPHPALGALLDVVQDARGRYADPQRGGDGRAALPELGGQAAKADQLTLFDTLGEEND